jgi:hypothetical protein
MVPAALLDHGQGVAAIAVLPFQPIHNEFAWNAM